jgi:hypothetical protein
MVSMSYSWIGPARLVAAALLLASCAPTAAYVVGVSGGTPATAPVFTLPPAASPFYGLVVARCSGGSPVWQIGTGGGAASSATSITYGKAPDGFATLVGPVPLAPGCYRVFASGSGTGHFTILPNGTLGP